MKRKLWLKIGMTYMELQQNLVIQVIIQIELVLNWNEWYFDNLLETTDQISGAFSTYVAIEEDKCSKAYRISYLIESKNFTHKEMMTLLQQSQRWPLKSIQVRLLFSDRFYLIQFFTEFPKNVKGRMKNLEFLGGDKANNFVNQVRRVW